MIKTRFLYNESLNMIRNPDRAHQNPSYTQNFMGFGGRNEGFMAKIHIYIYIYIYIQHFHNIEKI